MNYQSVETGQTSQAPHEALRAPLPLQERGIDLKEIVSILKRRRGTVLLTAAAVLLTVIAYLSVATPVYTATAQLLVEPRSQKAGEDSPDSLPAETINALVESQLQIIESRKVLARVVARERLDADPEFTGQRSSLSALVTPAITLLGITAKAPNGATTPESAASRALRQLERSTRTMRAEKSFVVTVRVSSRDPAKAAHLTNAVIEAYLAEQSATRAATASRLADSLAAQLPPLSEKLRQAEIKVQDYRFQNNIVGPGAGITEAPSRAMSEALIGLQELERNVDATREVYKTALLLAQQAAEHVNIDQIDARVISPAEQPAAPSWPLRGVLLGIGVFAGLGLGVSIALARDHFDDRFYTAQQADGGLSYPVLSVIPRLSLDSCGVARDREKEFLLLLDAVRQNTLGRTNKIILITSVGSREGKTTTARNLAVAAARDGERVLFVPVDTSPLDQTGQSSPANTSDVSADNLFRNHLYPVPVRLPGEDAVPVRLPGEDPVPVRLPGEDGEVKLFVHYFRCETKIETMKALFLGLRRQLQSFDLVVLDCGASAGHRLLRSMVAIADEVVLVAKAGHTRVPDLHYAAATLRPQTGQIGVVLNAVRGR